MSILFGTTKNETTIEASNYTVANEGLLVAHIEFLEATSEIYEGFHSLDMHEIAKDRAIESGIAFESAMEDYETVTEAEKESVWEKIKKAIAALGAKIKQFFVDFANWAKKLVLGNDAFIKSVGEKAKKFNGSFEVEGYDFTIDGADKLIDTLNNFGESSAYMENKNLDIYRELRTTKGDFQKMVYNLLRGGGTKKKIAINKSNIDAAIKDISSAKQDVADVKKDGEFLKSLIDGGEKTIENLKKASDEDALIKAKGKLKQVNIINGVMSRTINYKISAIREKISFNKTIVAKAAGMVKGEKKDK